MTKSTKPQQQDSTNQQSNPPIRRVSSQELYLSGNKLLIEHANLEYKLRITRQNKLILTK